MNASYEWLKAFIPTLEATPKQVRELLTEHAATVDDLVPLRGDLGGVVIARVVEAGPHPDSDHLWLTKVDAGGAEPLEVVCGAPNVVVGTLYPFAPVGTTLPNGMKLDRRKIRGIYSNGMLCSARELGLGEDHQGIMALNIDAKPGTPFTSAVPVGDTRLVIDVGANRPDLLSHLGIARELAAITRKKWELPELPGLGPKTPNGKRAFAAGETAGIRVNVQPETRTRRYMAAVVRGVTVGPSPEWLSRRLEAVGVRSINNIVDATNYVLHELGQPIHAFDLARLKAPVDVRMAKKGETLTTLDGTRRELAANAVVIADATAAQAVAGVMGGRESEVTDQTRDLLIEVASFDPRLTRAARKSLGLTTDASHRFERGVDPELGPEAMDRVVRLILALAGGTLAEPPVDVAATLPPPSVVDVRMTRVSRLLGIDVPIDAARKHLEAIGFELVSKTDRELKCRVPSWRTDVTAEVDLIEEIARLHGYDKIPEVIDPFRPTTTVDDPHWRMADRIRDALVGAGLFELRPMPFVNGDDDTHVRVSNPLAENEAHLRTSVLETLSRRAEFNLSHRTGDVRVFEIGSMFTKTGKAMPREDFALGILVMGRRRPTHFTEPQPPLIDEWDVKELADLAARAAYPGERISLQTLETLNVQAARNQPGTLWMISVGDRPLGVVRRMTLDAPGWAAHIPAFGIELRLGKIESDAPAAQGQHSYSDQVRPARPIVPRYRALPTMPPAEIDLALLVPDGTTVAEVEWWIRESAGDILEELELFDQYTGQGVEPGHRSLAWRLTFRHPERTLRDKEIEGRRAKILGALHKELNVRQRTA
jgi:phenylalanyl-tRNA synthetase beta chain